MTETAIDAMSRQLATARRWAVLLESRVAHLEHAIDTHRHLIRTTTGADEQLYRARDENLG